MPGNLRYGLTSGLCTASKRRRPGGHYLGSPFLLSKYAPELYTRFISSPAWDLIAQHSSSDRKLPTNAEARPPNSRKAPRAGVERVFILPEKVPRRISEFRFDFIHSGTNEVVPFPFRTENVGKTGPFLSCGSRRSREGGDCGIPPWRKRQREDGAPGVFPEAL